MNAHLRIRPDGRKMVLMHYMHFHIRRVTSDMVCAPAISGLFVCFKFKVKLCIA